MGESERVVLLLLIICKNVTNMLILNINLTHQCNGPSYDAFMIRLTCTMMYCQARALRALGLLLADGTPTVGEGKTF